MRHWLDINFHHQRDLMTLSLKAWPRLTVNTWDRSEQKSLITVMLESEAKHSTWQGIKNLGQYRPNHFTITTVTSRIDNQCWLHCFFYFCFLSLQHINITTASCCATVSICLHQFPHEIMWGDVSLLLAWQPW